MSRILEMARPPAEPAIASGETLAQQIEIAPMGLDIKARIGAIDADKLIRGRLDRLRAELTKRDFAAALLAERTRSGAGAL
jgi:hypothetical protein